MTVNYGLAGGTLDATKHVELARNPSAYMRRLAERPWAEQLSQTDEDRFSTICDLKENG